MKKENIITYSALALLSLVYISLCFTNNVWLDEAFTATLVHTDMADVLRRSMADTLPPLYNILLKLTTTVFGYHVPVMKLTSVAPMILTMLLGATKIRKRFGLKTALIFMVCIAGMPMMLNYGIEIRMYSLGFFFATASGIYAYDIIHDFNRRNCVIFAVMSALAGYSHHFAFVAVGFVYLFLLIYFIFADRANIKRWFICLAITVGLYIPCMIVTLRQLKSVSGYFSMPDVDLHLFIQYAIYPFTTGTTIVSLLLLSVVALLAIYGLFLIRKNSEHKADAIYALTCILVFYGVLLFGTAISKIMTANIFVDRYLFFSMGLIWLFVAIMIDFLPKGLPGKITLIASVVIIALSFASTYRQQFKAEYDNPADDMIAFIKDNFTGNDKIYTVEDLEEMQFCIPFYSIIANLPDDMYESSLNDALDDNSQSGGTTWIVVKDGCEISDEEVAVMKSYGKAPVYAATFSFERYLCDFYEVK